MLTYPELISTLSDPEFKIFYPHQKGSRTPIELTTTSNSYISIRPSHGQLYYVLLLIFRFKSHFGLINGFFSQFFSVLLRF